MFQSATCAVAHRRESDEQGGHLQINVSDQDVNDYYNAHRESSTSSKRSITCPDLRDARNPTRSSHLKNDKAQNRSRRRKKIQCFPRLDSGDDFATLAMNDSEEHGDSGNGGDLASRPIFVAAAPIPDARAVMSSNPDSTARLSRFRPASKRWWPSGS